MQCGRRLFLGLNCFEPGQAQSAHTHADDDKFYLLLEGKARTRVDEALARTVMLVGKPVSGGR